MPFFLDRYSVRSYYLPGFGMVQNEHWSKSETWRADVKRGYNEVRRIAPLMLGDYYPLTPYSLDTNQWIAWQFHRPDLGAGVVQTFRRPNVANDALTVNLHGLDREQRYEIENLDDPLFLPPESNDEQDDFHAVLRPVLGNIHPGR